MIKVDVICPIHFADPKYFGGNMRSWFKAIPINKLYLGIDPDHLIGMGGNDLSWILDVIRQFNHVEVKSFITRSLGYKILLLAREVKTEWFIYLHDDVLLFDTSWFIKMMAWKGSADIVESPRINVPAQWKRKRPYGGAQLFRTEIFKKIEIDDDFIYVNEDIIFKHLAEKLGYTYKRVPVYHYHQLRNKRSVSREVLLDMQEKAKVKYLS